MQNTAQSIATGYHSHLPLDTNIQQLHAENKHTTTIHTLETLLMILLKQVLKQMFHENFIENLDKMFP